jgi:hypothetical protein
MQKPMLPSPHKTTSTSAVATSPVRSSAQDDGRTAELIGGWSFIVASVGFIAVFTYLAVTFSYPTVLDGNAGDVLPELFTLGVTGRVVWIVYALLPLLLIPAALGANARMRAHAPNTMRAATIFATLSAICMFVGLARWPSIHWELARAFAQATPEVQQTIAIAFRALNIYLGNYIGEFLGELALSIFFALIAAGLLRNGHRRLAAVGALVAVVGMMAAFRNATLGVASIAAFNNYLLPVWLIVLGAFLVMKPHPAPAPHSEFLNSDP